MFTFGDKVAIVRFPGEMFAEFGLTLKEDSPFPITVVAELANGAFSYIPNRIAYKEGNYEPTSARLPVVPTLWQAASAAGIVTASIFWPVTVKAHGIDYLVPGYPVRSNEDRPLMEALSRPEGYLEKLEQTVGPFYIVQPFRHSTNS